MSYYLKWSFSTFRFVHSTIKEITQIHTHMCYSKFSNGIKDINAM
ncbi:hypothetical protein [Clostridium intestinale]|nr:hypothetical protein [Clostridium intestinale]